MDKQLWAVAGISIIVILGVLALGNSSFEQGKGRVAVITLSGTITPDSGGFGSSGITPAQVRELNQEAENRGADAIIYSINSGGGSVVASKDVLREVESVDLPKVCRFRDLGASGAYMFALGCDRIVADSATLTGSVGVRSGYFQVTGLMNKLGIDYIGTGSGKYKEIGSPYKNITEEQREILENKSRKIHDEFVETVRTERNLTDEQVEVVRTGEPFLGERAQKLGLVDVLGGRETALHEAENLTGTELSTFEVQSAPSFNLFSLLTASVSMSESPLKAVY